MRQIKYIVIHCTAGWQNQTTDSIRAHWRSLGWKRVGYHFLYNADGTEEILAPISEVTNGVAGFNQNAIHLSYKGGLGQDRRALDNRTSQQKSSMWKRVALLKQQFPNAAVMGHRDFSPDRNRNGIIEPHEWTKTCPSFSVREWFAAMTSMQNNIPRAAAVVNTAGGNLIIRATAGGTEIGRFPNGTNLLVIQEGPEWTQVEGPNGLNGFVATRFIRINK